MKEPATCDEAGGRSADPRVTARRPGLAAVNPLQGFGPGGPAQTTLPSPMPGGRFEAHEVTGCPAGVPLSQSNLNVAQRF